jgi:hypothetical protein
LCSGIESILEVFLRISHGREHLQEEEDYDNERHKVEVNYLIEPVKDSHNEYHDKQEKELNVTKLCGKNGFLLECHSLLAFIFLIFGDVFVNNSILYTRVVVPKHGKISQ